MTKQARIIYFNFLHGNVTSEEAFNALQPEGALEKQLRTINIPTNLCFVGADALVLQQTNPDLVQYVNENPEKFSVLLQDFGHWMPSIWQQMLDRKVFDAVNIEQKTLGRAALTKVFPQTCIPVYMAPEHDIWSGMDFSAIPKGTRAVILNNAIHHITNHKAETIESPLVNLTSYDFSKIIPAFVVEGTKIRNATLAAARKVVPWQEEINARREIAQEEFTSDLNDGEIYQINRAVPKSQLPAQDRKDYTRQHEVAGILRNQVSLDTDAIQQRESALAQSGIEFVLLPQFLDESETPGFKIPFVKALPRTRAKWEEPRELYAKGSAALRRTLVHNLHTPVLKHLVYAIGICSDAFAAHSQLQKPVLQLPYGQDNERVVPIIGARERITEQEYILDIALGRPGRKTSLPKDSAALLIEYERACEEL